MQVLSLGASAEYGNVAGAVFNIVTRQGSNTFHGDTNFYFQNQSLTGREHDRRRRTAGSPTTARGSATPPRSSVGRSSRTSCGSSARTSTRRTGNRSPARRQEFPAKSNAKRYFFKFNYNINQNHRLQYQQHDDFYEIPERASP